MVKSLVRFALRSSVLIGATLPLLVQSHGGFATDLGPLKPWGASDSSATHLRTEPDVPDSSATPLRTELHLPNIIIETYPLKSFGSGQGLELSLEKEAHQPHGGFATDLGPLKAFGVGYSSATHLHTESEIPDSSVTLLSTELDLPKILTETYPLKSFGSGQGLELPLEKEAPRPSIVVARGSLRRFDATLYAAPTKLDETGVVQMSSEDAGDVDISRRFTSLHKVQAACMVLVALLGFIVVACVRARRQGAKLSAAKPEDPLGYLFQVRNLDAAKQQYVRPPCRPLLTQ